MMILKMIFRFKKERQMKILLSTFTVLFFSWPVSANDLSERLLIAKQYSEIIPVQKSIDDVIDNIIVEIPKDDRVIFESILRRTIKKDRLEAVSEMALADIFTKAELEAMVAFYASEEGKAIHEKMPGYRERLEPIIQEMLTTAAELYKNQTR
jgi:hypothetical protein